MHPLVALRKLLQPDAGSSIGVVTALHGDKIRVSCGKNTQYAVSGTIPVHMGDTVLIESGMVLEKVSPAEYLPIYYL